MFWWLIFVLFLIFVYKKLYKPHQFWKKQGINYIRPWPIVGNMGSIFFRLKEAPDALMDMYTSFDSRYIGTYGFMQPTLLIKDIELMKKMFIKNFDHFVDRNNMLNEDLDLIFGKSLFFLQGQRWREMRATLSPAFTSSKMRLMFSLIIERAENLANHFALKSKINEIQKVEMKDVTTRFANDVIASCAFGIDCNSLENVNNEFYCMGKRISTFTFLRTLKMFAYFIFPGLMKFLRIGFFENDLNQYYKDLVIGMMRTREEKDIVRPDMINLLMEAKKGQLKYEENKKHSDAGFATVEESQLGKEEKLQKHELTDEDITAQAALFLAAGFETTSTMLSFMSYELALNEDVQRKLQQEIDETLENGKVTYETILKMQYMDMVVSECLRKWTPVLALDRVCVKPYTIEPTNHNEKPLHLEKNSIVWFMPIAMHRDPKYFPDPDRFEPERFSEENKKNIVPFSYLPFGIGPRNCIGSRFALLEIKAMFFYLLAKFNIIVIKETEIPLKLDRMSFNLSAKNGFWLGLQLRHK